MGVSKPTLMALMAIFTSLMLGNVNAMIYLEKVKPLIWLPTENYVETQINDYDLTYVYSNPCSQLKVPDSIKKFNTMSCKALVKNVKKYTDTKKSSLHDSNIELPSTKRRRTMITPHLKTPQPTEPEETYEIDPRSFDENDTFLDPLQWPPATPYREQIQNEERVLAPLAVDNNTDEEG